MGYPTPHAPYPNKTFKNDEDIVAKEIDSDPPSIGDEMKEKLSSAADQVNKIVKDFGHYFGLKEGQDLYGLVIEPISGDFNRIKANGEAWADVGDMLDTIFKNFNRNATRLVTEHWGGPAADAFRSHVDVGWEAGLWAASRVARWMQKGFDMLARLCLKLAKTCADIFRTLVDRIVKLCLKAVPVAGWAVELVDWIADGFEHFPYWDDIQAIIDSIKKIQHLQDQVEKLVSAAKNYVQKFQQAVDALKAIPEVVADTIDQTGKAFKTGIETTKQLKEDVETQAHDVQDELDQMESTSEEKYKPPTHRGLDVDDVPDNKRPDYPHHR